MIAHFSASFVDLCLAVEQTGEASLDECRPVMLQPAAYAYEKGYYAVFLKEPDGIFIEFVHCPNNQVHDCRPTESERW